VISLAVDSSKDFMGKLLASDAFDSFLLQEASIITSVSYSVSGRIHPDFFSDEDEKTEEEFIPWNQIRPRLFELIKGKNPPVSLKMTLLLGSAAAALLLQKESPKGHSEAFRAFALNIRFENGNVTLISGTSYDSFVPDKSLDIIWDETLKRFLTSKGIGFEVR